MFYNWNNAVSSNFLGCRFFDKCSEEKNRCAAEESGGRCKLSQDESTGKAQKNFGYFAF